jgi:hypothetical protein
MMKVVINPSWTCQLSCAYCWLPHTKINRQAVEHGWQEWAKAIIHNIPAGSIIDVSGGEPLLFEGIELMLAEIGNAHIGWAITTNALATEGVERLIRRRPPGCAIINISDHAGNAGAHWNIVRLGQYFPIQIHRTSHPMAGKHEANVGVIPYQPWKEGEALDGVVRKCNAGMNHWVIDPGGDIFRCCVDMQVANRPIGNLFGGKIRAVKAFKCDFGCSTCYTTEPWAWQIEQEAALLCTF